MDVSQTGDKVYVALQNSNIAVITTATDTVGTINFGGASSTYGVAIAPGTNKGYVTDEFGEQIFVFNVTTETEITGPGLPISGASFDLPRAIAAVAVLSTSSTPVTPVPTLSVYGLVLTMLGLLFVAARRLRTSAKKVQ